MESKGAGSVLAVLGLDGVNEVHCRVYAVRRTNHSNAADRTTLLQVRDFDVRTRNLSTQHSR